MSDLEVEAPGSGPVDVTVLQAQIENLNAAKEAGQPGGSIDAMIAELQAQIDAANAAVPADAAAPVAADAAAEEQPAEEQPAAVEEPAADLNKEPAAASVDSVNVTVYVGDAVYTGTIPKQ